MADYALKINGTDVPKIISYGVEYDKLWSSDSGRVSSGKMTGTLVGVFTKLVIQIGTMTAAEAATFLGLVNVASANVTYWDYATQAYKTESFYFGDAKIDNAKLKIGTGKPQSISIIARSKRT